MRVRHSSLARVLEITPLVLAGFCVALPAAAGSPSKNVATAAPSARDASPAKDDIMMVELAMKSIPKKMADPHWGEGGSALDDMAHALDQFDKRLARIKQRDPAWNTAAYDAFLEARAKMYEDRVNAIEQGHEAVYAKIEQAFDFQTIGDRWGRALDTGFQVLDQKPPANTAAGIAEQVQLLSALENVVKECAANNYPSFQAHYENLAREKQPVPVCNLAARYQELEKQLVPRAAKALLDDQVATSKAAADKLAGSGATDPYTVARLSNGAQFSQQVTRDFSAATSSTGARVDAGYFKSLEASAKQFQSALAAAAKVNRFPTQVTTQNATLQRLVKADADAQSVKLVRFRANGDGWGLEKNALGIPLNKWNDGVASVQVSGEPYCRVYGVRFAQPYTGGGTFDPPQLTSGFGLNNSFTLSACQ